MRPLWKVEPCAVVVPEQCQRRAIITAMPKRSVAVTTQLARGIQSISFSKKPLLCPRRAREQQAYRRAS
eukprot:4863779-Karenia_brevis.AAC.1